MIDTSSSGPNTDIRCVLFVAGDEPNSRTALKNLEEFLNENNVRYRSVIEVIDVYRDFERALKERIVVTPTLFMITGNPPRKTIFFGCLQNRRILLNYLDMEGEYHGS